MPVAWGVVKAEGFKVGGMAASNLEARLSGLVFDVRLSLARAHRRKLSKLR